MIRVTRGSTQVGAMSERAALGCGAFDELLKFSGQRHRNCGCKLHLSVAARIGKHTALTLYAELVECHLC